MALSKCLEWTVAAEEEDEEEEEEEEEEEPSVQMFTHWYQATCSIQQSKNNQTMISHRGR